MDLTDHGDDDESPTVPRDSPNEFERYGRGGPPAHRRFDRTPHTRRIRSHMAPTKLPTLNLADVPPSPISRRTPKSSGKPATSGRATGGKPSRCRGRPARTLHRTSVPCPRSSSRDPTPRSCCRGSASTTSTSGRSARPSISSCRTSTASSPNHGLVAATRRTRSASWRPCHGRYQAKVTGARCDDLVRARSSSYQVGGAGVAPGPGARHRTGPARSRVPRDHERTDPGARGHGRDRALPHRHGAAHSRTRSVAHSSTDLRSTTSSTGPGRSSASSVCGWRTYVVNHTEGGFPQMGCTFLPSHTVIPDSRQHAEYGAATYEPMDRQRSPPACSQGVSITDACLARLRTPQEVNWGWMANFDHDFIGRDAVVATSQNRDAQDSVRSCGTRRMWSTCSPRSSNRVGNTELRVPHDTRRRPRGATPIWSPPDGRGRGLSSRRGVLVLLPPHDLALHHRSRARRDRQRGQGALGRPRSTHQADPGDGRAVSRISTCPATGTMT